MWNRALVTGASSGIGAAFAHRLAGEGVPVVAVARRADRLAELPGDVEVLVADLTDPDGVARVEARLAAGDIDLLVNNAGFGTTGAFAAADVDRLTAEIALDVTAVARLTRAVLPSMVAAGRGGIVNVSSVVGFFPTPRMAVYAGAKAFVTAFTQSVAEEVKGQGVRVVALCPGLTRTEFQEVAHTEQPRNLPAFVWQSPEAVVDAAFSGLRSKTVVVVPGAHNKALVLATRLTPRSVLRTVAGAAQRGRRT